MEQALRGDRVTNQHARNISFEIKVIGDFCLAVNGENIALISSRKTRALLAYLAVTDAAHSRSHLCDLFFEKTHDPRGALRWSLSKLRRMLGDQANRLITTYNDVQLDMVGAKLDVDTLYATSQTQEATCETLLHAAKLATHKPFGDLELPQCPDYNMWLQSERAELQNLGAGIFRRLTDCDDLTDDESLYWLRQWFRLEPSSHDAPQALWRKLKSLDRLDEASRILHSYKALMGPDARSWQRAEPTVLQLQEAQSIDYVTTPDGVKIAHSKVGSGPPLIKTANWLNHLELDWQSPIWGNTIKELAKNHTVIRYDERGNGLSDWDTPDISFDAFVSDLETLVDSQPLDRFPLLGMSQGCAVSIAYAVKHPERVSALVLIGGYAAGWRISMTPEEQEQREAVLTLTRLGWGTSNPAYRHIFSQTFMPDADASRLAWFDDFQRQTTSTENAVRFQEAFGDIDVRDMLGQVQVPTLVLHATGDQRIPLHHGRDLAAAIPGAKFVALDSRNHIILGDEPAWRTCMDEIAAFLDPITSNK